MTINNKTVLQCTSKTIPDYLTRFVDKREVEFKPADTTWVYGSTEANRQIYIERLIRDKLLPKQLSHCVIHVDKVTRRDEIIGKFLYSKSKIVIIHNLKKPSIGSLHLCRIIDGDYFYDQRFFVFIYPERVYISSDKLPEQVYARCEFKERVIRRVARTIKLD
jgi:hypothetical protein